eukprot:gb/GEZN01001295.1/.p1 GENE.gb/GEZN01001295.1/~~gb/GEZN01001295.1/.p1  ORF type:complete len:990 (+),score=179.76 gb/GEZN01001295.1/:92-2971(+)
MMARLIAKVDSYVSGAGPSSPRKGVKKAKGKRMTENEEDKILLQEEEDDGEFQRSGHRLTRQPTSIKSGTLREYQLEALNWMIQMYDTGISGILADEMGLGKTLQSISLLAYLKEYRGVAGPHLVVVPLSTLGNWMREFKKWCPILRLLRFHGNKEERPPLIESLVKKQDEWDVCISSYEMVNKHKGQFQRVKWVFIVVDEAHRMKNENSLLSLTLRGCPSRNRLLLTGTPLQNNLHELWALLNFLLPDIFADSQEFDQLFVTAEAKANDDDSKTEQDKEKENNAMNTLTMILRPFMLRRLKTDVETSLPPKKEMIVMVPVVPLQGRVYKGIVEKNVTAIQALAGSKSQLLNIVMQLRKAAIHPYLFDGVEDRSLSAHGEHLITNSGKVLVLDKLLKKLKAQNSRVLIFSQMTRVLDILEDYCLIRRHKYCRLDGGTSTVDREKMMEDFNAPGSDKFVFLLSTRAGGLGINLYTADIVVLFDSDWNPQMDLQAQDRAHRIGQKKPVFVYRFVSEGTIEEKIIERAAVKLRLDAMVIQSGKQQKTSNSITKDDLKEAIMYGAETVFRSGNATITDEDIDIILSKGEKKTAEMELKLQAAMGKLHNLSLTGSTPSFLQDDETEKKKKEILAGLNELEKEKLAAEQAELSKPRQRIGNYNIGQAFKTLYAADGSKTIRSTLPKPFKLPRMGEFQFYNVKRINEICEKEKEFYEYYKHESELPPSEKAENAEERTINGLTLQEIEERDQLLSQGFKAWKHRHFYAFVSACERYGRTNLDKIAKNVPGHTEEEVRQYHEAFFRRISELSQGKSLLKRIEKGETRMALQTKQEEALTKSCANIQTRIDFMDKLEIKYRNVKKSGFTMDNDKLLLYLAKKHGYGEWEKLQKEIKGHWQCSFDYYLKSRSPNEIGRRVDVLIRLISTDATKPGRQRKKKEEAKTVAATTEGGAEEAVKPSPPKKQKT